MTAGATGNGSFGKIYGLAQGLVHSWRTYHPGNSIQLVGYNPHTDVFVNEFVLAVAEGGGAATYQICLGPTAPAADVAVAVTRRFTHIEVAPPVLTYTTSNWPLPQTVTVAATNGVVIEPPQTDTVAHTVTSADAVYDGAVAGSLPVNVTDNDGSTDLALVVTKAPDTVLLGQTFDVSYRLTNNGSTLSTGATFTTSLTGLAYMTVIGATCSSNGPSVTFAVTGLASGAQLDITVTLVAQTAGTHANTMTVTGHQPDPVAGNHIPVHRVTVN